MNNKIIIPLLTLFLGFSELTVENAYAYNIADAIASAKKSNKSLKAQEQQKKSKKLEQGKAMSEFMPRVIGQNSRTRYKPNDNSYISNKNNPNKDTSTYTTNTVSIEQSLFNFGGSLAKLNASKHTSKAADKKYESQISELITKTTSAYNNVKAARNSYYVALQKELTSKQIMEQAQVQFESGVITRSEMSRAQYTFANSIAEREMALANLKSAEANYFYVVGEEPAKELMAIDINAINIPKSSSELVEISLQRNLSAIESKESWNASKSTKIAAIANLLPSLNFSANTTKYNNIDAQSLQTRDFSNSIQYSLNINVPIFDAQRYIQVKGASYDELTLNYSYQDIKSQIESIAVSNWNKYNAYKANVMAYIEAVKSSQDAFDGTEEQFRYGTKTMTDLLNAQTDLYTAKLQLIKSEQELIDIIFSIKNLTNELSDIDFDAISLKRTSSLKEVDDVISDLEAMSKIETTKLPNNTSEAAADAINYLKKTNKSNNDVSDVNKIEESLSKIDKTINEELGELKSTKNAINSMEKDKNKANKTEENSKSNDKKSETL